MKTALTVKCVTLGQEVSEISFAHPEATFTDLGVLSVISWLRWGWGWGLAALLWPSSREPCAPGGAAPLLGSQNEEAHKRAIAATHKPSRTSL